MRRSAVRGILPSPSTSVTLVRSSSIVSFPSSASASFSASVTTRPPNVGSSLNQPTMGMTVKPKMVVSNVEIIAAASKSRCWPTRPTVEAPHEPTCKRCNRKNRSLLDRSLKARPIARKKGEDLKSSTEL